MNFFKLNWESNIIELTVPKGQYVRKDSYSETIVVTLDY